MGIEFWEKPEDVNSQFTFNYWNDVEAEKKKAWWVETPGDCENLKKYLNDSGLSEELKLALYKFPEIFYGEVLDVAAGVCWTTALISKLDMVSSVDALEFSLHRLDRLADVVIEGLEGTPSKIRKIYGSFYNMRKEKKYDLIFMSQAFHHADFPIRLLIECDGVLKQGGSLILLGEHLISRKSYIKRFVRINIANLLNGTFFTKGLVSNFYELFLPDEILGDHYYRLSDYYFMFQSFGFKVRHLKSNIRNSFILCATKS